MCKEAVFRVKKNGKVDFGVSLHVPLTFPPSKRGNRPYSGWHK